MGTIKADTLSGLSSTSDVTIASNKFVGTASGTMTVVGEGGTTQTSLQQGLCKCWIHFNGTGTIATDDSFNVSGITDEGTGSYTVTINNDMANDDYAYYGFSSRDNSASQVGMFGDTSTSNVTTGKFRVSELAGSFFDVGVVMCAVHGDLA